MNIATVIGLIATFTSVFSFLPQVVQSWKTKDTKSISIHSYTLIELGSLLWFTYGILKNDAAVFVTNGIIAVLVLSILLLKFKHG